MRPISRIEALCGAFAKMLGFHDPLSKAYQLRNPLMLRAFSVKHEKDEEGYRIFSSFSSGWDSGILDLKIKCSGNSHAGLKADDTLVNLVQCFGYPRTSATYIKKFLRHALKDDSIMEMQPLKWFMDDQASKDLEARFS